MIHAHDPAPPGRSTRAAAVALTVAVVVPVAAAIHGPAVGLVLTGDG